MRFRSLLISTGMILGIAQGASGSDINVKIEGFTFSSGCGMDELKPVTQGVPVSEFDDPSIDAFGRSCRVYFKDFKALLDFDAGYEYSKNCHMKAKIRIPAGVQFRATQAELHGVYDLADYAEGSAELSYTLDATNAKAYNKESFPVGSNGDFSLISQVDRRGFTPCSNEDQFAELSSHIRLNLSDSDWGFSSIVADEAAQNSDIQGEHNLSWHWQVKKCQLNYFERPFVSYYKAYNNRNYKAVVSFDGDRGYYDSDAGFRGYFKNLTYSKDGMEVSGEWEALNSRGWISFKMLDIKSGRFEGTWGDKNGTQGRWWGYYK